MERKPNDFEQCSRRKFGSFRTVWPRFRFISLGFNGPRRVFAWKTRIGQRRFIFRERSLLGSFTSCVTAIGCLLTTTATVAATDLQSRQSRSLEVNSRKFQPAVNPESKRKVNSLHGAFLYVTSYRLSTMPHAFTLHFYNEPSFRIDEVSKIR